MLFGLPAGVQVVSLEGFVPTPFVPFAVTHLHCAGINPILISILDL